MYTLYQISNLVKSVIGRWTHYKNRKKHFRHENFIITLYEKLILTKILKSVSEHFSDMCKQVSFIRHKDTSNSLACVCTSHLRLRLWKYKLKLIILWAYMFCPGWSWLHVLATWGPSTNRHQAGTNKKISLFNSYFTALETLNSAYWGPQTLRLLNVRDDNHSSID